MDQGGIEGEAGERADLTFFIETQLADAHPGVIRVRELRKGVKRFLKHSHVFLYQLDRGKETIGETIARLIYEDQTEDRMGRYKGPRWDWQQATRLHLIQVIEQQDPGRKARPVKREVGTAHIPGDLDAPAIIATIARVIDEGLQPPPLEEAYRPPESDAIAGATPSTSAEHPFPLVVQCVWNYRTLTGPVVFIAMEDDGVSIDQCAVLLPGASASPSFEWYHLFRFEDNGEALLLCDQGIHERTEPIMLYTEEGDSPPYWIHEHAQFPIIGGKRVPPHRIHDTLKNIAAFFAEAIPSSIYCSDCRREYWPGPDVPMLQEAARRGYVTTICSHIFWCPFCQRWSTPTERTPRLATGEVCPHRRPAGWESRLSNTMQEIEAPSQEAHAELSHKQPLPHPFYDGSFQVEYELSGKLIPPRNPGRYLPATAGEISTEQQPAELDLAWLVTFLEDCRYDTAGGESDFVPKGTRLIGFWETDQPEDTDLVAIVVNNVPWNLSRNQVVLTPLGAQLSQEQIAAEDEAEARRREKLEDHAGAQVSYARAIIEYEASGWTEVRRAPLRVSRAGMLLVLKQELEAASELERAARAFEAQAHHHLNRMVGDHLDYAEQACDALVPLAMIYLRTKDTASARRVIARLLALNSLIKKRYERKVDLLLSIAECYLALGEQQEALAYYEQANRFYAQQLAPIADFSYVIPITKHLHQVKERLHTVKVKQARTIRFTATAKTPDDLEAVLEQLQKSGLRVEVTKGVTPQHTSKDARSGLVYVANIKLTIDGKSAK
jgi:tetratricopeptide (TPR) repeat protein